MSQKSVILLRRVDGAEVVATLRHNVRPGDLTDVEQEWASHRARIISNLLRHGIDPKNWPQSLHWDWSKKTSDLDLLASTGFAIELDGATQRVMLTKTVPYVSKLDK